MTTAAATAAATAGVPLHDAVTAVLTHDGAVLILRRQPHLPAFPGYHAFPGGKVDRADFAGAAPIAALSALEPRLARALLRETREELGVDLAELAQRGELGAIRSLGMAVTPAFAPMRFATRYYSIEVTRKPDLHAEAGEIAELQWAPAADLIARFERGDLLAVPPTIWALRALARDARCETIPELHAFDPAAELPWIEAVKGVRQIALRSNTLPPADRTNCFLIGDDGSRRILVDPSPNSAGELERLCAAAAPIGFDEVFLTHHHPDHCQHADEVARRFRVPIAMSADTRSRLGALPGDLEVRIYREGDEVARWLGHAVRAIEVPGHDEGQLALMPDNRAWCIVGDLYQGIGTVVIGGAEGNMRKYFESLRKIIALDPRVIYPSHGLANGTVWRLQETLRHRQMREQQVKAMFLAGKTEDEMLGAIYAGLADARLLPFARMNIRSHLQKLREENALTA